MIVFFLILGNIGCSNEDDFISLQDLTGSWVNAYDVGKQKVTYREEWTFKDDGTYEFVFKVVDRETDNLLGYNTLSIGIYSIDADTLNFGKSTRYFIDSNERDYTDRETLLLGKAEELAGNSILLKFEDNAMKMIFIYLECNDVSSCPGSREFVRF